MLGTLVTSLEASPAWPNSEDSLWPGTFNYTQYHSIHLEISSLSSYLKLVLTRLVLSYLRLKNGTTN